MSNITRKFWRNQWKANRVGLMRFREWFDKLMHKRKRRLYKPEGK